MRWLVLAPLLSACSGLLDLPVSLVRAGDAGLDGGGVPECEGDQDAACPACSVESCRTLCGSVGAKQCTSSCSGYGRCMPPLEDCASGGDENCDDLVGANDPCCREPANDLCSGAAEIPAGGGTFEGCTQSAAGDTSDSCAPSGGPDVFYEITLAAPAHVTLSLEGSEFDTVVYVRSRCEDEVTTLGCADDLELGGGGCSFDTRASFLSIARLEAGTHPIVVDSPAAQERGRYRLQVTIAD